MSRMVRCQGCKQVWRRESLLQLEKPAPSMRRISDKQEKRNARDVGGRRTLASGALKDKADVKLPGKIRMECKSTGSASYGLKKADLEQLQGQTVGDEVPVFMIEFRGTVPSEYAVVPKDWLLHLLREYAKDEK